MKLITCKTALLLTLLTGLTISAHAQSSLAAVPVQKNENGLTVGINAQYIKNAYDSDNNVAILPSLFYDNDQVYARGSQFGAYIINDEANEFAGYLQLAGDQFDSGDANGALSRLDDRDVSIMAGLSYMRTTPIGGFRGQLATDITGNSEGSLAKLSYIARISPGKWTIYPSAGLEWVDSDFNEYYYGISNNESIVSGIEPYKPDSSVSPYITLNGMYALNQDWDIFVGQTLRYLSDEQYDSPMVDDRVSSRTTLGLLYKF